jgi:hypothetical protein
MSQAPTALPVEARLLQEVRDPRTGELFGWVNGDRELRQALRRHGFHLVMPHQGRQAGPKLVIVD